MDTGNDDFGELSEINVEVVPLDDNTGSAVIVDGVIPEATGALIDALLGYCVSIAITYGYDIESSFKEAIEFNQVRSPQDLH